MNCTFQELLDCFDNDLENDLDNNGNWSIMQKNYRKF